MHSTRLAIKERVKSGIDVVIEMLDARCPGSSRNPLLAQLAGHRPKLKVLNKQDLADPERTALWLAHYNAMPDTQAIAMDTTQIKPTQILIKACRELAPLRGGMVKPLRVLICGIPNVGKSTLINSLMGGKRAAKTGDEPGITKIEQKIMLAKDVQLYDTPGMLWPKIETPQSGYILAASGAVGRNALDEEEVALELLALLRPQYSAALQQRYGLTDTEGMVVGEVLEAIGRKRAAMLPGGRVNLQKAAEVLIYEFRQGLLGRVSLETPEQFANWAAAVKAAAEAAALAKVKALPQRDLPQEE